MGAGGGDSDEADGDWVLQKGWCACACTCVCERESEQVRAGVEGEWE